MMTEDITHGGEWGGFYWCVCGWRNGDKLHYCTARNSPEKKKHVFFIWLSDRFSSFLPSKSYSYLSVFWCCVHFLDFFSDFPHRHHPSGFIFDVVFYFLFQVFFIYVTFFFLILDVAFIFLFLFFWFLTSSSYILLFLALSSASYQKDSIEEYQFLSWTARVL